jgi:hypothetical protein
MRSASLKPGEKSRSLNAHSVTDSRSLLSSSDSLGLLSVSQVAYGRSGGHSPVLLKEQIWYQGELPSELDTRFLVGNQSNIAQL